MNLVEFVQEQREKRGLTQESLASSLGISRPTYIQVEQGKRELTVTEAEKLSAIFGIQIEDLLQRKESPKISVKVQTNGTPKKNKPEEIRISVPQEKAAKFRQILLYILKKVGGKPNVGMTVLYKLLYFIDFDYYEKYEDQLMGLTYVKNTFGPTPPLFETIMNDMIKNGEVEVVKSKFYEFPQTKYLVNPEIEPDLSILNGQEQEHIDGELQRLSDMTAAQLSELSHNDVPFISAVNDKTLDYESVFYRTAETSVREYERDEEN
jgi:DNA-binding XRE family transcriptional regulator